MNATAFAFSGKVWVPVRMRSPVADDLNGDGKADVVGIFNGTLFVYVDNGDRTFTAGASYTFASNSGALALGDFNADGKGDLALQGHPSFLDTAEIYLGNGDGTFSKANSYPLGNSPQLNSFGIAIADFNGDGKADIAASNVVLLGNGDGTFQGKLK